MCASEPVWSHNSKNIIFISVRCLEMLKIAIWKMTSSTDTVFGLYFLPKIYISTWNLACQRPRHGSTTSLSFFLKILKILDFWKGYIEVSVFIFGVKDHFVENLKRTSYKTLYFTYVDFFTCILFKIAILGDFSNIYEFSTKNDMALGHLHRIIQKWFEKILQNSV